MKRTLAVGLIGYEFMGKAHSNPWRQAPRFFDLPADVRMKTIFGRNRAVVKPAATKFRVGLAFAIRCRRVWGARRPLLAHCRSCPLSRRRIQRSLRHDGNLRETTAATRNW